MLTRASLLFPALILWLVGAALAAAPAVLYRGDTRSPATIKASGGFKALGTNRVSIETHVYKYPKDTYLVSYSASKDRSMFFTDDDGYTYAIDTTGISFTDAAAYIEQNKANFAADIKAKIQNEGGNWSKDDLEWVTPTTVPYTAIIGWKRVVGNTDGAWEKNTEYTGCLTVDGLQKRACAMRPAAAKPPAKQQPAQQQSGRQQPKPIQKGKAKRRSATWQ